VFDSNRISELLKKIALWTLSFSLKISLAAFRIQQLHPASMSTDKTWIFNLSTTLPPRNCSMVDLRQRKGPLAVDRVDRLDEPKEHVHINRVVRQGPLQGAATFVGLLVPLIALRAVFLGGSTADFWRCFPMAMRSISGPISEAIITVFKRHHLVAGRERWIAYCVNALLSFLALASIPLFATAASMRLDLKPCAIWLIVCGIVVGSVASVLDSLWPKVCYRLRWIESTAPPSSLSSDEEVGWNPYNDVGTEPSKLLGHFFLTIRLVNQILLVPLVEELFYRDYLFGKFEAGHFVPVVSTAFLWACFNMHYKGEWFLRFAFGAALQTLVLGKPVSCGLVPSVAAQAARNLVAAWISIRYRRWYRWNI
jgi:membrane protease YdiL (CAAX protease family)